MTASEFRRKGWCRVAYSQALANWAASTLPHAREAVADPANHKWLRCGGTWFAGVNVLPNDAGGRLGTGPALPAALLENIRALGGPEWRGLDRAQVSVCTPGYPRPMAGETAAAFRFRRDRDAAHLDGLLRKKPGNRRYPGEKHAFLLGIPLVETPPGASPFVVWEGSHEIFRNFLASELEGQSEEIWQTLDLSEPYQAIRRRIFDECERVEITAKPGEAYIVHRFALHGMAPWAKGVSGAKDGRMIVYFRPETGASGADWLAAA